MESGDSRAAGRGEAGPLERLRSVLRAALQNQAVDPAVAADTPEDRLLVELLLELVRFAQTVDMAMNWFLVELSVGPSLSTLQMKGVHQLVANRIAECLAGRAEAIGGLRESLERDRRFILHLNEAYRAAIPAAVRAMLDELAAGPARAQHGRFFGLLGAKQALEQVETNRAALADLPPEELLQQFFLEPFRRDLMQRIGAPPPR
jgi:hypothetical protein